MHIKLLIDSIMQQTTVLSGQLSTAAGVRAPLAFTNAVASKLQLGTVQARGSDVVGGATRSSDVHAGHPYRAQVVALLAASSNRRSLRTAPAQTSARLAQPASF
jgi:hypothetical protein